MLLLTVPLAAMLIAAAPADPRLLSDKFLVQCSKGEAKPGPVPQLEPAVVDAALSGQTPPPAGWEVKALPGAIVGERCWLAARVPASTTEQGVWIGTMSAATTVWLDGNLVWRKGREEGPYWRGDQGFNGFILAAPLLAESLPRVLVIRTVAMTATTNVPAPSLVDPIRFPELQEQDVNLQLRLLGHVMWLLFAIFLGSLVFFVFRRDRRILYFAIGAEGFSLLFVALTAEHMALDHNLLGRLAMIGTFASYPFYALFFQHLYGIHRRPLHDRLAFGMLALVVIVAVALPTSAVMMTFALGAPFYFGAIFYALYLNVRARREGNEIARSVLWGFGAYFLTIAFDGTRYFLSGGGNELQSPTFQFGVIFFVISIVVAITRHFLRLSVESSAMLAQLQGAAKELGGLVTHLQTASTQLSSATAEQVTALTETASTTTEMNQTSALSASRAAELIQQGEAVTTVVADGKSAAESSRTAIQEISSSLSTVSSASGELAERVQRIDRIIDTVSFLADQSAALAINASIEASRAGEAGQGFAAVAREVRSLANDSRRATAEVREVLDEIRSRTLEVESQVTQGARIVEGGVQQVSRLAQVVDLLGGTIQNSVGLMRQVEASARQHQAGVEQVLQAVTNIQRASESIRDGAETLSTLSRQANSLSSGLVSVEPAPARKDRGQAGP